MERISVILPVYGVEKYLDRCVESVVSQTYSDLEIILVDDGSPDSCPAICDAWARRDPRIRVIHKENQGCGMARNTGLEQATGRYVCFFDSDDYILPDTIEKAYRAITAHEAEIVLFGSYSVNAVGRICAAHIPRTTKQVYREEEIMEYLLPNLIGYDLQTGQYTDLTMSACMMCFSMPLIRRTGWRFVSERVIPSEDIYSLLDLFGSVSAAVVLPEALYCYCHNAQSLTRAWREDRYEKARLFYTEVKKLCRRKGYPASVADQLRVPFLNSTSAALKQIIQARLPFGRKYALVRAILADTLLQEVLSGLDLNRETRLRRIFFAAILRKDYFAAFCLVAMKENLDWLKNRIPWSKT